MPPLFESEEDQEGKPTIYITSRAQILSDVDKFRDITSDALVISADQLTTFDFYKYIDDIPPAIIITDCPIIFDYKYWYSRLNRIKLNKEGHGIVEFSPIIYFFTPYPLPIDESFVSSFIIEDLTANI